MAEVSEAAKVDTTKIAARVRLEYTLELTIKKAELTGETLP